MEYHEYANLFPMMNTEEIRMLCQDMQEHGYDISQPITLFNGLILDGRNRQKAADTVGIIPEYSDYTGNDPLAYVLNHNLHRRHLNESQRAVVSSRLANMRQGERTDIEPFANLQKVSQSEAAVMLNVSPRMVASVKAIEKAAPEFIPRIESGEMTVNEANKEIQTINRLAERAEIAIAGASVPESDKWHVYQGDIKTWIPPRKYDYIITDPPYPKEYLYLWEYLAERAYRWLKPGGLLIAMSGESYLNDIYNMMDKHLKYYWTGCYLTPGQSASLRQKQVNNNWKPLLIYSIDGNYTGKIFGDVFTSGNNDKDFHKWGQSESGMIDIVSKICLPGQYILDPFCGAGTTGIAALSHGCLFDGLELDIENVNISKERLNDRTKA